MAINVNAAPTNQSVPTPASIEALNSIREEYNLPSTSYSDVFSTVVNTGQSTGLGDSLAQFALKQVGDRYKQNNAALWEDSLSSMEIKSVPNWRHQTSQGTGDARARFAKAYNVIDVCSLGMWGSSEYDDHTSMTGVSGGGDAFPIFPADMRYIANGPASSADTPELGFQDALSDLKISLRDQTVGIDYLNCAAFTLFSRGVIIEGERVPGDYYATQIVNDLMSSEYQRYLREVKENTSPDIQRAADYFFNLENGTIAFLTNKTSTQVFIERKVAQLQTTFTDVYHGEASYTAQPYFDTVMLPYLLDRVRASVQNSEAEQALSTLISILSEKSPNAAERNHQIENLLDYYASGPCIGLANDVVLSAAIIQQGIDVALDLGLLKMTLSDVKSKILPAIEKLNKTGLLGAIGFLSSLMRAASDTLSLSASIADKSVTASQVLTVLSHYLAVYCALGKFLNFINVIKGPAKTAFLSATKMLKFDRISAPVWGNGGLATTGLPAPNTAAASELERMTADIARHFSELPFDQEINFIEAFFEHEIESVAASASRRNIAQESAQQAAADIEHMSENAISLESALVASKAFAISLSLASFLEDALLFAATVVDLAESDDPTTQQILDVSSKALAVGSSAVGAAIACGFLESAAFPPLALALTVGAVVLSTSAAIVSYVEARQEQANIRQHMATTFQKIEADGYLHEWGEKIQFLAVYYDTTRDKSSGSYAPTRWSPPDVAIFADESAAWNAFKQGSGDTRTRFIQASHLLVHAKLNTH